jgi:hypothetical protein
MIVFLLYKVKQKTINMHRNINKKIGQKPVAWYLLSLWKPVALSASLFIFTSLQPMPVHNQIRSQEVADRKSITRHMSAAPKISQPVAVVPKVVTPSLPSNPLPAPVKTSTQTAGTPKPEPVVTPSPSSSVSGLTPTTPAPAPTSSQTPSPPITTGYTSTNWSGYLATDSNFTSVSGSWTATRATASSFTTSADSTWIGIGGVSTSDLIQVGTQNIITSNDQVSTSAFYELLPGVSQPVPGVEVSPGDSITASLSEVSSGQWTINITDKTDGESGTISVSYASSLSSAEWIEEDPSFSFRRQIPFDDFHEASFTNGSTVANGSTVNIAASTAQPVTMVNSTGQVVAVPSAIGSDGASFTVAP